MTTTGTENRKHQKRTHAELKPLYEKAKELRQTTDLSDTKIAEQVGLPQSSISRFFRKLKAKSGRKIRTTVTNEMYAKLLHLHEKGKTNKYIANKLGLSPSTVGNYVKALQEHRAKKQGLPTPPKLPKAKSTNPIIAKIDERIAELRHKIDELEATKKVLSDLT